MKYKDTHAPMIGFKSFILNCESPEFCKTKYRMLECYSLPFAKVLKIVVG